MKPSRIFHAGLSVKPHEERRHMKKTKKKKSKKKMKKGKKM
jgi:hypothetical protein